MPLFRVDRGYLRRKLAGEVELFLIKFLPRQLLRGDVLLEFASLFELLAPGAESFSKRGALRMGEAERI